MAEGISAAAGLLARARREPACRKAPLLRRCCHFPGRGAAGKFQQLSVSSPAPAFPSPFPGNLWKMAFFLRVWVLHAEGARLGLFLPARCRSCSRHRPGATGVGTGRRADVLPGMPAHSGTHRRVCVAAAKYCWRKAGFLSAVGGAGGKSSGVPLRRRCSNCLSRPLFVIWISGCP